MDMWTAVQTCFEKYAEFNGRARRSEYWWFWLFIAVCSILVGFVDDFFGTPIAGGVFALGTLMPCLAAGARRLHDTNRSGWLLALPLAPILLAFAGFYLDSSAVTLAGSVLTLGALAVQVYWLAGDTSAEPNRFGPVPE